MQSQEISALIFEKQSQLQHFAGLRGDCFDVGFRYGRVEHLHYSSEPRGSEAADGDWRSPRLVNHRRSRNDILGICQWILQRP
jgi:hypothetical protein